jgi:osmotically-inducible protein OsmY
MIIEESAASKSSKPLAMVRGNSLDALVADALASGGYLALRHVRCETHGDRVTLSGHVPSYHLKQIAQTLAMRVAGTCQVQNRIEVAAN